jgi:CheY-like chemotaxis protein
MDESATNRLRILIVDDEESIRLLLASLVSGQVKSEVQLAGTCEQALRLAETTAYDGILLDLRMPGIGGLAVLQRVRRSGPNARTPIIVVSAVGERDAIERCLAAGATAYVAKPVNPAELGKALKKHFPARSHARN